MSLLHTSHSPPTPHTDEPDIDPETATFIAQLAFDDIEYALSSQNGDSSTEDDHQYASSLAAAWIADAAYLEAIVAAEEAAAQDRLAAEMLARGEELPPQTLTQRRLEDPTFVMEPNVPVAAAAVIDAIQHLDGSTPPSVTLDPNTTDNTEPLPPYTVEEEAMLADGKGKLRTDDDKSISEPAPISHTSAAYLEAILIAEQAAAHDRLAAEMLARGEELPPQTDAQKRIENPVFIIYPEPPTPPALIVPTVQRAEKHRPPTVDSAVEHLDLAPKVLHATVEWTPLEEYRDWDQNASILAGVQKSKSTFDYLSLAPGPSVDRRQWVQCTVCYDSLMYSKAFQTPCDHNYCGSCIGTLVVKSTLDESLFPPRCCNKPIPIADVDPYISPALRTTFQQKHAEFSILPGKRVYCAQPTCSTFLGSSEGNTGTTITCSKCSRSTCLRCKQAQHHDEDCVPSEATLQLRALAQTHRWQTCPSCGFVVELTEGCYHMTCRCGIQFCYQCSAIWKTCAC